MDLHRLNPPQKKAVTTLDGPLLVLAGAGSGKTRVITHRIAYLLGKNVSPKAILAVTFTNKAAAEMKERVVHLAGKKAAGVTICTFHAFGAELLRAEISKLGFPKRFAIADMGDQLSIVKRAMRERSVDDRAFDARKVLTLISRAKNTGIEPQPKPEGMGDDYDLVAHLVYPLYQTALRAQGAVDFDDLLVLPAELLRDHPEVRRKYVQRFKYLLVDEFQDTNQAQMNLLTLLAGEANNVCAVGDDDQCIYSWRGAEVKNVLEFSKKFPGGDEVRLEQNYRSTQVVLDAANAVIALNPNRKAKRMWTDKLGGERINVVIAPSEDEEARYVVREIGKHVGLGVPLDEIAVLYRTNGQAHLLEEALREKSISYEVVGGSEFFDRREVKDVVAYFKVLANPRDEVSLLRIVNVPARGIGDVTMERLLAHSKAQGLALGEAMERADEVVDLPQGAAGKVREFLDLLERYRKLYGRGNLAEVTSKLLTEIGFGEALRSYTPSAEAADRRLRSIEHVINSLANFEKREGKKSDLFSYLNRLALDTREEEDGPQGHRVTLMTLHGAKGLEYRVVFLIGMEEDLVPHAGMQGEPQNIEEERRLAYVGITRARELLYLTRCATRIRRGKEIVRTPSRFLQDIPAELTQLHDLTGPPPGPPTEKEKNFFSDLKAKLAAQRSEPTA